MNLIRSRKLTYKRIISRIVQYGSDRPWYEYVMDFIEEYSSKKKYCSERCVLLKLLLCAP